MAETEAIHGSTKHVMREAVDDFPSEGRKPPGQSSQYRLFEELWDVKDGVGGGGSTRRREVSVREDEFVS